MDDQPFLVVGDTRLDIETTAEREVNPTRYCKNRTPTPKSSRSCIRRFTRFPNTHWSHSLTQAIASRCVLFQDVSRGRAKRRIVPRPQEVQ